MEEYKDLIEAIEKLDEDLEDLEELLNVVKSSWGLFRWRLSYQYKQHSLHYRKQSLFHSYLLYEVKTNRHY